MTTDLLDINVLLALSDPMHVHHEAAHQWFAANSQSWATCPITENGFVRIASHPNYPNRPGDTRVIPCDLPLPYRLHFYEFLPLLSLHNDFM